MILSGAVGKTFAIFNEVSAECLCCLEMKDLSHSESSRRSLDKKSRANSWTIVMSAPIQAVICWSFWRSLVMPRCSQCVSGFQDVRFWTQRHRERALKKRKEYSCAVISTRAL